MVMYGYARVSTKDQNLNRQLDALTEVPISREFIYVDHMSGKNFERPGYTDLCAKLVPGDVVVIESIDRLGRNYEEILEQWRVLTKITGVDIVVLDMPLLDTRATDQDLTGLFISDLVLQILSYVAQIERENTRKRQAEGIASARARGVRFGRPELLVPPEFEHAYQKWRQGQISCRQAAASLGVSRSTFNKWAEEAS